MGSPGMRGGMGGRETRGRSKMFELSHCTPVPNLRRATSHERPRNSAVAWAAAA